MATRKTAPPPVIFPAAEQLKHLTGTLLAARENPKWHNVHDLRVAIRRFSQALRIFKSSFSKKDVKRARAALKKTMTLAGEARNFDIAAKVLRGMESAEAAAMVEKLRPARKNARKRLEKRIAKLEEKGEVTQWEKRFTAHAP